MPASSSQRHLRVIEASAPALTVASVYREYLDFVMRSVKHLGVEVAALDDVVHDVFLVVHRRLPEFTGQGSLRSWLYGIARRVVMHHYRLHARRGRRDALGPVPAAPPDPERVAQTNQAAAWIDRFLAQLDPAQRIVFVLADIEGMTAPEIGAATGAALNTVYSRLRLARRRFERALAERSPGEGEGA